MFTTDLILIDTNTGKDWYLHKDLIWQTEKQLIIVPAGFRTDLASIPRLIRSFYPKTGKQNRAAVLHDYCYRTPELFDDKAKADRLFLKAMISCGVRKTKAKAFYRGVKWFGGSSWRASR